MICVNCGKPAPPGETWPSGWCCLFGNLAACSVKCAQDWARENARWVPEPGSDWLIVEP